MFALHGRHRAKGIFVVGSCLIAGGYAYTNAIGINDLTNAGEVKSAVADVSVDNNSIAWTDAGDPMNRNIMASVQFTATSTGNIPATDKGYVQLVTTGATAPGGSTPGEWFPCTVSSTGGSATETFTCDLTNGTTPLVLQDVDEFRTVVHD